MVVFIGRDADDTDKGADGECDESERKAQNVTL